MTNEGDLYKRRIVAVLDYFDEDGDLPWNYVARTGDGRFEGFATHLVDHISGKDEEGHRGRCVERSLGVFDDCDAAVKAVGDYVARVRAAERDTGIALLNEALDFGGKPTIQ